MTEGRQTPIRARLGPITAPELVTIGIETVERLAALGWQEAFVQWVEAYPERLNVNAAVGLAAAELGVSWLKLPAAEKARARALVDAIRAEWGLKGRGARRGRARGSGQRR